MAKLNFKKEAQIFVDDIFVSGTIRLIEASEDDKRILKELDIKFPNPDLALFEGVYLMADEANKNRHYLSLDTVSKAVGTIKMKPVNWFHKRGQPIGVYINGSVDIPTKAMRTVGVLWRSLFPERVAEIETLIKSKNSGQSFELTYEKRDVRKDTSIELFNITFKGGAILPRDKAACQNTSADVLAKMLRENVVMGGLSKSIKFDGTTDDVNTGGEKKVAKEKKTKKIEGKESEKKVEKKEPEKKVESKKKAEDMSLEELESSLSEVSISVEERKHIIDAIVKKKVDKILADKALYNERRATLTEFTDEELANINILQDDIFDKFSKDNQIKVLQKVVADHERNILDIKWLEQRVHQLQHEKQDKVATGAEDKKPEKKADKKTDNKSADNKDNKTSDKKTDDKPADKKDDKAADKVGDKKHGEKDKKDKAADKDVGGKDKKSTDKSGNKDTKSSDGDNKVDKGDNKKDKKPDNKVDDKKTDTKDKSADKGKGSDNKNTDDKDKNTKGKLLIHGMPKVVDESVKKQMINVHEKQGDK